MTTIETMVVEQTTAEPCCQDDTTKDAAVTAAEATLAVIVDGFSAAFKSWEDAYGMGANIRTHYDGTTGRKQFWFDSVGPRVAVPPPAERVAAAGEIIAAAGVEVLSQTTEGVRSADV